jgi:hypothetical protein
MSDHFDGRHFFNPNGAPAGKSFWQLLRWKLGGGKVPWPRRVTDPPHPPPPAGVGPGEVAATFVGHATWLLRFAGGVVLTDPVWSWHAGPFGRLGPRRVRPPGVSFEALSQVDAVLLSHNHYDHLDTPTLRCLGRAFRPRLITPLGNGRLIRGSGLRDVEELDWWQSVRLLNRLEVTLTPAQHFSAPVDIKSFRKTRGSGLSVRPEPPRPVPPLLGLGVFRNGVQAADAPGRLDLQPLQPLPPR